jgi:hypothetical protein
MGKLAAIIAATIFAGLTGTAFFVSGQGIGLPGRLSKPVSIRQQSTTSRDRGYLYFGRHRRHSHGGFRGGK